jgi:hypothetical protein
VSERLRKRARGRRRQRPGEEDRSPGALASTNDRRAVSPAAVTPLLRRVQEDSAASALRPLLADRLLALQTSHGNEYVQRLVERALRTRRDERGLEKAGRRYVDPQQPGRAFAAEQPADLADKAVVSPGRLPVGSLTSVLAVPTAAVLRDEGKGEPKGAPAAAPAKRKDYVFIMGKGSYYTVASKYYASALPAATLVKDRRNLAAVFEYLRELTEPVGNLYIVSHANQDGTLSFPLAKGDKDKKVTFGELREAVKSSPELFELHGQVDKRTTIHIKGCNIGRAKRMVELVDEAFGGLGTVIAPTHKQYFEFKRKGKVKTFLEFLSHYFIERVGSVKLPRPAQLEAFMAKYAHLSKKTWEKLLPKKGAKRKVDEKTYAVSSTVPSNKKQALANAKAIFAREGYKIKKMLSFEERDAGADTKHVYTFEGVKGGERFTLTLEFPFPKAETVIADAKGWAGSELARPEMYKWELGSPKRKGVKLTWTARGRMTEYTVGEPLTKEPEKGKGKGALLTPEVTEEKYFTVSKFEPAPAKKP